MKKITELTDLELVSLKAEEIKMYKMLACAEAGVPIALESMPLEPPEPVLNMSFTQFYQVGNWLFDNQVDANDILAALSRVSVYESAYDIYPYYYAKKVPADSYSAPKLEVAPRYDREEAKTIGKQKKDWEAAHKAWEDQYGEVESKNQIILDEHNKIDSLISAAWSRESRREQLRRQYEDYLKIAEENVSIALGFMEKVVEAGYMEELRAEKIPEPRPMVTK